MTHKKIIKLIEILATFDNGLERFGRFLTSPSGTKSDRTRRLFYYLEENYGHFSSKTLEPKTIFNLLYPEKEAYESRKVSEPIKSLTELLEVFIPKLDLEKNPASRKKALRNLYRETRAEQLLHFEQVPVVPIKKLGAESALDWLNNRHDTLFYFENTQKSTKVLVQIAEEYAKANDIFYTIHRLKAACNRLHQALCYEHKISDSFKAKLHDSLSDCRNSGVLTIRIFAKAVDFFLAPQAKYYADWKTEFYAHVAELPPEKTDLLHFLIQGLQHLDYAGGRLADYFSLYRLGVAHDCLHQKGFLSSRLFLDVLHTAYALGEVEWAERFCRKSGPLSKTPQKIAILVKSYQQFGQKKYRQVIANLRGQHFRDLELSLKKYTLILKSIYALKGHDEFLEIPVVLNNFRALIKRQKPNPRTEKMVDAHRHFIKILREISKQEKTASKNFLGELQDKYKGNIAELPWLHSLAKGE